MPRLGYRVLSARRKPISRSSSPRKLLLLSVVRTLAFAFPSHSPMKGGRLASGAIVHSDICRAAAVGDIGDERDDGNAALNGAVDGRGDFQLVWSFQEKTVRAAH